MITDLIAKMKLDLQSISKIGAVYPYIEEKPQAFPAVCFYHDSVNREYWSNQEDFEIHRFKLIVLQEMKGKTEEYVMETLMPNIVDEIIDKFKGEWDLTSINSNIRTWSLVEAGIIINEDLPFGKGAVAELDVVVKFTRQI